MNTFKMRYHTLLLFIVFCFGPTCLATDKQGDWCREHQIAEKECPWCKPSLIKSMGFCGGHGVPEAFCYQCNPRLIPAFKSVHDWCDEHDKPESQCSVCNGKGDSEVRRSDKTALSEARHGHDHQDDLENSPRKAEKNQEQAKLKSDDEWCREHQIAEKECPWCKPSLIKSMGFCKGHSVPEAFCYRCNPRLIPAFKSVHDWCVEHDKPESQCEECGSATNTSLDNSQNESFCPTEYLRINFASEDTAEKAGLETVQVTQGTLPQEIKCNAEIHYDKNHFARLAPRASGVLMEVIKDLGDQVNKNEILAWVDSPDLGAAKSEFLQAIALATLWKKNYERESKLAESRVATERELLEAETRLKESEVVLIRATQKLYSLGLTEGDIKEMVDFPEKPVRLAIRAPFDGVVVARNAVSGEVVSPVNPVVDLADMSVMWVWLDVYERDLSRIRTDLSVVVRADGIPGRMFKGKINWISPEVNPDTRTVRVRVPLENTERRLLAGLFAEATIDISDQKEYFLVPKAAVQWEGCCHVVFIKKSQVLFIPRKIQIAFETDYGFAISGGLSDGDDIVTTGSFLLKTELLKENIGAGCCEVHPGVE